MPTTSASRHPMGYFGTSHVTKTKLLSLPCSRSVVVLHRGVFTLAILYTFMATSALPRLLRCFDVSDFAPNGYQRGKDLQLRTASLGLLVLFRLSLDFTSLQRKQALGWILRPLLAEAIRSGLRYVRLEKVVTMPLFR